MSTQEDPKYQLGGPPAPPAEAVDLIISPDTFRSDRIPPGQSRTRKWPVLHAGDVPEIDFSAWRFDLFGLVKRPLSFTLQEFRSLPRVKVFSDFHCVTRWSRLGNLWEGVSVKWLLEQAGILPEAAFVIPKGYDDGWTTNLPLSELNVEDVLLADVHDGIPLDPDHGGPVRLVVPRLYAWKSAKWIRSIEIVAADRAGYWEELGYHMLGDPWTVNDTHPDGERLRDDQ